MQRTGGLAADFNRYTLISLDYSRVEVAATARKWPMKL